MAERSLGCIHFNGIQHDACRAGINMRAHVGGDDFGWAKRIPCLGERDGIVPCDKRRLQTAAEADAEDAEFEARFAHIKAARAEIVQRHGKQRGVSGQVRCPACSGLLAYSIAAYNGHIHARCETDGCVSWIE